MIYDTAKRQQIKNRRLIKHFTSFIDRRWYPTFTPTEEVERLFLLYQTHGRKKLTPEQLKLIEPLHNGQKMKELTLRMIVEEMCDWWANDWGWYYPLQSTIDSVRNDRMFLCSLLRIKKRCQNDFLGFLLSFTGISHEQKMKYLTRKGLLRI